MAKTAAERKRDERQRMRKAGFVLLQIWVRPKALKQVVEYVRRVNRREESR